MTAETTANERRVLLLTPTGKDAQLISKLLLRAGCEVLVCEHAEHLCHEIATGAAAVIVAEEGLPGQAVGSLARALNGQPAWSDLPVIVLTAGGKTTRHSAKLAETFKEMVNLAFLERPLRMLTLVSAVRAACRARDRQYQIRSLLGQAADEVRKRDRFIAMLGHELRNPLAAIRTSIEIINHFGCQEPSLISDQCEVIDRQSKHMARLVDDLLDVARLTSGRVSLTKSPIDLRDVVSRSVQVLRLAAAGDNHSFSINLPQEPVVVEGDAVRLEQVFGNILSNSVRYSRPGGKIEIKLETAGGAAAVRIKDEGDGIEPELLPQIFEPFVQSSQPLARRSGGLGLGLAVVRSLVELHGGVVAVASKGKGAGSEFTVTLPYTAGLNLPSASADANGRVVRPKKILVVEDNADARKSLSDLLRLMEHEVFEAEDGSAGLEKLVSLRPDFALIDIGLPRLTGYEVVAEARPRLRHSTVMVAITGYGQAEDRERAIAAGFDAHLVKPIDLEQLAELLSAGDSRSIEDP